MTDHSPTLWEYVAPADRETLVAGTLAWLLDPNGTHGLDGKFVADLYDELGLELTNPEDLRIEPEAREGMTRRFDILIAPDGDGESVVLEVKTKTSGSDRQLRKYAERADHVFRVGFEEWNYFELDESARDEFPLLQFSEISDTLEAALEEHDVHQDAFLRSFLEHLQREYALLHGIREFFVEESIDAKPAAPSVHRYSERHLNKLYWRWFLERWTEDDPSDSKWGIGSEKSGVWCSSWASKIGVGENKVLKVPGVDVALPGPFKYNIHMEIWNKQSVLASDGTKVGVIKISVDDDRPEGKGLELYETVKDSREKLIDRGFRVPGRRPSDGTNFTVLRRILRIEELRYSRLVSLLKPWLREDAIV